MSLAETHPEIAKQWHPDKNQNLTPFDVTRGSNKRIWWKCERGHEWETTVKTKTRRVTKYNCPYCNRKKVSEINSLVKLGRQRILDEWNNDDDPANYSVNSNKVVSWKCLEYGHVWTDSINHRAKERNCPYCSNHRVHEGNSLATMGDKKILKEWNPKNKKGPECYTVFSNKKVWWICELGHEWETTISHRSGGYDCPYCKRKYVSDLNSVACNATKKLLSEWHPKNKNGPETYSVGSHKKVWWKCDKGHEWMASMSSRILKGSRCLYCCGQLVSDINRLTIHAPAYILREWSAKNIKPPSEYSIGTDKKVWWKCEKGHEYQCGIGTRVRLYVGCPVCNESRGERERLENG